MFIFLSHLLRTIFYSICYIEQKENLQTYLEHRIYSFLDKLPFHVLSFSCFVLFWFWIVILYVQSRTRNSKYGLPTNVRIMSKEKPNNNTIAASTTVGDKTNCNIVDASVVSSGGLLTAINSTFYRMLQNILISWKTQFVSNLKTSHR